MEILEIFKWPIVVIIVVIILKKPLTELINGIVDFNIGGKNGVSARVKRSNFKKENNNHKNQPEQDAINSDYYSKEKKGRVSFDYSNNNGTYTIGEGEYRFDTMWTKASNTSIHFYNDKPTIKNVRLVKDSDNLVDVIPSKYDSSSRARTAEIGQIAVFENNNGKFLITKILDIKDDSRGDENDNLTFEYIIKD